MTAGQPVRPARAGLPLEHRMIVTARWRGVGRLDGPRIEPPPPDPTIAELVELARALPAGAPLWLTGGEPTLRADLPALIAALARCGACVGLCSDGLALPAAGALAPLLAGGLASVRLTLHAARADAHDWLVGRPGAARRVRQAVDVCRAADLAVELAALVTRPTAGYLAELVEVGAALGARALWLSLPAAVQLDDNDHLALSPRLGLLAPELERAADAARRLGLGLRLCSMPRCVAPALEAERCRGEGIDWLLPPDGALGPLVLGRSGQCAAARPRGCPGRPDCDGPPPGYLERFGAGELGCAVAQAAATDTLCLRLSAPLPMACDACADVPVVHRAEPTRAIRQRLVRAAGHGARVLRIAAAGSLHHPALAELLAELPRLPFERVELCGEGSALEALPAVALAALARVDRLDLPLYGPDATRHDAHIGRPGSFAATCRAVARLGGSMRGKVSVFGVLHDHLALAAWADGWRSGRLPGAPAFKLSPQGGSLDALAAAARPLGPGAVRDALACWLPSCLLDGERAPAPSLDPGVVFDEALDPSAPPAGSDRLGARRPCACGGALAAGCPGVPAGWRLASTD